MFSVSLRSDGAGNIDLRIEHKDTVVVWGVSHLGIQHDGNRKLGIVYRVYRVLGIRNQE